MKKSITNKRSLVLKKKVDKKPIEIQSLPAQEPTPMEQILLQMAQNQAKQNEMIEKQSAMLETISSQLNNAKKEEAVPEQPKKTQAEIVKGRNQVSVKEKIVWRIC